MFAFLDGLVCGVGLSGAVIYYVSMRRLYG